MRARRADEPHRVATPLELFFDLCFVVAVAQAAALLHQSVAGHHVAHGLRSYLMVFFAIWWAWMNFTWFASAYDTDDDLYRLVTMVQIAGVLVLAAGVGPAFTDGDYQVVTAGYVVMRLALVTQWLRAAKADAPRRRTALRYATGVTVAQGLWLLSLLAPHEWSLGVFLLLVVAELAVPVWAELAPGGPTTYHPHHIAERYGLFTLMVLGEAVAAATIAFRDGLDKTAQHPAGLLRLAVAAVVIVFALWWLYFDRPVRRRFASLRASLSWGYGHYCVFAAAAAAGAGLSVAVDRVTHPADVTGRLAGYAIAVPVAVYLLALWLLLIRPEERGRHRLLLPGAALLTLVTPLLPVPIESLAALLVALVTLRVAAR
ncbi:low temperature requirement protein A [Actinoplanes ianthinogenes]|nr:low temperature requirement protein A [Actinoplanes ianthinogenes]